MPRAPAPPSPLPPQDNAEAALVGIVAAGVSDWADGHFARHMKTSSVLGSYLDPLADKARWLRWGAVGTPAWESAAHRLSAACHGARQEASTGSHSCAACSGLPQVLVASVYVALTAKGLLPLWLVRGCACCCCCARFRGALFGAAAPPSPRAVGPDAGEKSRAPPAPAGRLCRRAGCPAGWGIVHPPSRGDGVVRAGTHPAALHQRPRRAPGPQGGEAPSRRAAARPALHGGLACARFAAAGDPRAQAPTPAFPQEMVRVAGVLPPHTRGAPLLSLHDPPFPPASTAPAAPAFWSAMASLREVAHTLSAHPSAYPFATRRAPGPPPRHPSCGRCSCRRSTPRCRWPSCPAP